MPVKETMYTTNSTSTKKKTTEACFFIYALLCVSFFTPFALGLLGSGVLESTLVMLQGTLVIWLFVVGVVILSPSSIPGTGHPRNYGTSFIEAVSLWSLTALALSIVSILWAVISHFNG